MSHIHDLDAETKVGKTFSNLQPSRHKNPEFGTAAMEPSLGVGTTAAAGASAGAAAGAAPGTAPGTAPGAPGAAAAAAPSAGAWSFR